MESDLQKQREMLERLGSMWQGMSKPNLMTDAQDESQEEKQELEDG